MGWPGEACLLQKKFLLSLLEREEGRERKTLVSLISKKREIWKERLKARVTSL